VSLWAFLLRISKLNDSFLKKTIDTWQPHSNKKLTEEDAREMAENVSGLFSFLSELEKKYGKEEKKT
jgi:hypothetical protein